MRWPPWGLPGPSVGTDPDARRNPGDLARGREEPGRPLSGVPGAAARDSNREHGERSRTCSQLLIVKSSVYFCPSLTEIVRWVFFRSIGPWKGLFGSCGRCAEIE